MFACSGFSENGEISKRWILLKFKVSVSYLSLKCRRKYLFKYSSVGAW